MIRNRKNSNKVSGVKTIMLKIEKKGGVVYHIKSGTIGRFRTAIRTRTGDNYRIIVGYGKHLDSYGNISDFYNEGSYKNREEALKAFDAFVED